jgi:hypothetical protein
MTPRLTNLQSCPLHKRCPFGIRNVSMTQFSVARYYGGIDWNGERYTYFPDTDELVRDDVLRWMEKQRNANKKTDAAAFP